MEREDAFFERLGQAVRVERTRRGMHQDELAEAAGLSKAYVSHIENGRRHASMDAVQALAKGLTMTIGQLLATAEAQAGGQDVHGMASEAARGASVRRGVVSRADAEAALVDVETARRLGDRAQARVAGSAPPDGTLVDDVRLLATLVLAYAEGSYRGCRHEDAVLVAGALGYLATELDQLPDWLGEQGLHDDLGVLAFTLGLAGPSIEAFRVWALAREVAEG